MCNNGVGTSFITCDGCSEGTFVSISDAVGTANWIKHHWTSDHTRAFSRMSNFQIGVVTLSFSVKHAWITLTTNYFNLMPFLIWKRPLDPWSNGSRNYSVPTYRMSVHQYHKLRQASLGKRNCKVSLLEFEKPMQKVPLKVSFWFRVYLFRWKYKKKVFLILKNEIGAFIFRGVIYVGKYFCCGSDSIIQCYRLEVTLESLLNDQI